MDIMRNRFTIGMAGFVIQIDTISPRTCILCMDYLQEGLPDIYVKITKKDVEQEFKRSGLKRNELTRIENATVYRKLVDKLVDYNIVLIHGAVIAINNEAYLFSAPSGTGKTTHILKWLNNISGCYVVNGDKPLIKMENTEVLACGTPWSGNENMNTNTMVPLKAIVYMSRAEDNHIEETSLKDIFPFILQQTYQPNNEEKMRKTLNFLQQLYGKVKFYHFHCNNFKDDCFGVAYNALVEGSGINNKSS